MEDNKPTEEEKVVEMWKAYKSGGLEGIEEVLRQRNEEYRQEKEVERQQGKENQHENEAR